MSAETLEIYAQGKKAYVSDGDRRMKEIKIVVGNTSIELAEMPWWAWGMLLLAIVIIVKLWIARRDQKEPPQPHLKTIRK